MSHSYSGLCKPCLDISQNIDRIECDEDGWTLKVNDEPKTDSFLHLMSPTLINHVKIRGHAISISYVGFGGAGILQKHISLIAHILMISDLTPAPVVGFNLTFVCPEGQVFDHDWFASPFVMMTCQVTFW